MDWLWIFVVIMVAGALKEMLKPKRCGVCDQHFKKKYFTWTIEGKKMHLCPNCNSQMKRRVSSVRFKDKFGK